jgi:hypothetical protein
MEQPQTDPFALAALVIGLFSWMVGCCGGLIFPLIGLVSVPCALIGIVLGGMSMQKISRAPEQWSGKPLAIGGIVINLSLLLMVLVMSGLMLAGIGVVLFDELM